MRIAVTKTVSCVINTADERARIDAAFSDAPDVRRHLHKLMDAIDALDWRLAHRMLCGKWWQGRDKDGTRRLEYLGLPFADCRAAGFSWQSSYADLVSSLVLSPANYKAEAEVPLDASKAKGKKARA